MDAQLTSVSPAVFTKRFGHHEEDWIMIEDSPTDDEFGGDALFLDDLDMQIDQDDMSKAELLDTVGLADWEVEATSIVRTIDLLVSSIECFLCQEEMFQPTAVPCCGFVYCRNCIQQWVSDCGTCPCCFDDLMPVNLSTAPTFPVENTPDTPSTPLGFQPGDMSWHLDLVAAAQQDITTMTNFLVAPLPPSANAVQCAIRFENGVFTLVLQESGIILFSATQYDQANPLVMQSFRPFSSTSIVAHTERSACGSEFTLRLDDKTQPSILAIVQTQDVASPNNRQALVTLDIDGDSKDATSITSEVPKQWMQKSAGGDGFKLVACNDVFDEGMSLCRDALSQCWLVEFRCPFSPLQAFAVSLGKLVP
ncbi:unnamed protein product [Aphanomyces euteiches]|uniref:RING-type domain-containing protein n=2 Tax=Aphanomyces euteiches TaxID=100861 RepID=A0A6G0XF79_9STRA|nr:hypothetical protein Ae201684_005469 [Aphanomyces euteiches]KAH9092490.1 hypothetical protein Ae201684P_008166 [Aphanomyces euteiches]KAH9133650.1 hypothetical protein AeRB84_020312 [Aphanomyces euteiches]